MIAKIFSAYTGAKSHTRSFISGVTGFIFYGGWAYFVHYDYGHTVAFKAFLTQGLVSFSITLALTQSMESMYKLFSNPRAAYWGTAIIVYTLVVVFSFTINAIVGTPEIFFTILPGSITSAIYTFSYVRFLSYIREEDSQ